LEKLCRTSALDGAAISSTIRFAVCLTTGRISSVAHVQPGLTAKDDSIGATICFAIRAQQLARKYRVALLVLISLGVAADLIAMALALAI
jgi:hypothetical protein